MRVSTPKEVILLLYYVKLGFSNNTDETLITEITSYSKAFPSLIVSQIQNNTKMLKNANKGAAL